MCFLHILSVTSFVGIALSSVFFVRQALNQKDNMAASNILKTTFLGDWFVIPSLAMLFVTGMYLVQMKHLSLEIPWIFAALITFIIVVLCWLVNFLLRLRYFYQLKKGRRGFQHFWFFYCVMTVVMFLLFIIMMHDAITQSTFLMFW